MDIFPIWKSTYFFLSGDNAVVRIIAEDGVVIYRARVSRIPDEDYMHVNLNKPCQAYIDSRIVPVDTEDAVYPMDAYEEFVLQQLNESTGVWADIYSFAFKNDWSYEDTDTLSEPINGHAAAGQVVSLSYLVTGNPESVCYDVVCPEPGPTPPPPPPTPTGYSQQYLTFQVISGGTIYFSSEAGRTIQYTRDDVAWHTLSHNRSITVSAGEIIKWKGYASTRSGDHIWVPSNWGETACRYNVYGNIMSVLYGDDFIGQTAMPAYAFKDFFSNGGVVSAANLVLPTVLTEGCFSHMFEENSHLVTVPSLPATTLAVRCYNQMFWECDSLVSVPQGLLPATTLVESCYEAMFGACSNRTTPPALPATALAKTCYFCMFVRCTSLTTAPALPATTLANECYGSMFEGCTSLTTAPDLLAYLPVDWCYDRMFAGCHSLNYVKCLTEGVVQGSNYTINWLSNTSSTGTFVQRAGVYWMRDVSGIPWNWTITEE